MDKLSREFTPVEPAWREKMVNKYCIYWLLEGTYLQHIIKKIHLWLIKLKEGKIKINNTPNLEFPR